VLCDSEADGVSTLNNMTTPTDTATSLNNTTTSVSDVLAAVTQVSESTSRVSASVTDELPSTADDTVPGSPHTAASSISSPSELSTDIIDERVNDATTIPLVRSPSTADTTLHIRPQPLTQTTQPLTADNDVDDLMSAVTDVTVESVSELSAGVTVSENGLSAVTTSSVITTSAPSETTAARITLNETTIDNVSDEVLDACYVYCLLACLSVQSPFCSDRQHLVVWR